MTFTTAEHRISARQSLIRFQAVTRQQAPPLQLFGLLRRDFSSLKDRPRDIDQTDKIVRVLTRRDFLKRMGLMGGSLIVYATIGDPETLAREALARAPRQGFMGANVPTDFNAFVHIGADNRVTCFVGKIAIGQGPITSFAQILAEDLDVTYEFTLTDAQTGLSAESNPVEVVAENGNINGYGEGAPRSYVTGESQASAVESISNFTRQRHFPWQIKDVSQLWHFIDSLPNGHQHNSAICAIETALLDAFGKSQHKNIIEYFPKDFLSNKVYYGATLPLTSKERILEICHLCKALKINTLRIKVGKNFMQTKETIDAIRSVFGDDYVLRVDINGAWDSTMAIEHMHLFSETNVKVVEQPIMHGTHDIADFAKLMQNFGIALMADESAGLIVLVNKWDAVEKDAYTLHQMETQIRYDLNFLPYVPVLFISAQTGQRVNKIFPLVDQVYAQYAARIGTGQINRIVNQATIRGNPLEMPLVSGPWGPALVDELPEVLRRQERRQRRLVP